MRRQIEIMFSYGNDVNKERVMRRDQGRTVGFDDLFAEIRSGYTPEQSLSSGDKAQAARSGYSDAEASI